MIFRRCFLAFAFLVSASISVTAQTTAKPYATVNGETVSEEQVLQAAAKDLAALEAKKASSPGTYDHDRLVILHQAMSGIIEDKLIAAAAARDKSTKEQIIFAEIESNVETPSAEEVEEFYQANKSRIGAPHDQAIPLVKQYMMDQQRNHYRDNLIYTLTKQFPVKVFLDPVRTDVATAGFPSRGPDNAPVTIVEFADFECPYCGGLFKTLKIVEKSYPDKVRFVYRQFPLTNMHPHAQKAAEASLCAKDQNRFWEFYDSMFGNQENLAVDDLKKRAVDFKMGTAAFNTCLDSGAKAAAVSKEQEEGRAAGVSGTPAMFINGRFLGGNQPYADIREIIEDELQRRAQPKEGGK